MKIKWKIVLALDLVILALVLLINITVNNRLTNLVATKTSAELVNYSNLGLSLIETHYPGEWRLEGTNLYKGDVQINDNYEVVDEFSEKTGILATIFAGDTRVSTTVKDDKGNRMILTQASDEVKGKVLTAKESYQGTAPVVGRNADTYYVPLSDSDGNVVGMWFVGIYSDVVQKEISNSMLYIIIFSIIFLIIGSIVSYVLGDYIVKGYIRLQEHFKRLENGDFCIQFESNSLTRKDEIGGIFRSYAHMQDRVKEIITSIKDETNQISQSSGILADGADNVHRDVEDISATTEELSAGMEETSASTEEMNATSVSIQEEIINVTNKAEHGQKIASEIKKRAEDLKRISLESQKTASEIYDNANRQLRASIDKTAAIKEIQALSKTILDITAQTNLLALNASIEAARAGDAGKGFAVVASEIAVLARNSKNAVSQIDEISNDISSAVDDIVKDSRHLLEFMDTKVIKDYDILVKTGGQYHDDANTVDEMVTEIKNSATQLNESVTYMRQAIDEVTLASVEGSKGSADIAEKSSSIFDKTNEVLEQANLNREIAVRLNEQVKFFQV
jgi:methyl-accepting chemotaxis protein